MSELKTYKMVDEKYCTDCVCVIPSEVYLKSEVDAVITELKDEINRKEGVELRWFDRCMEARAENVKLKRALYKACANWAKAYRYPSFRKFESRCLKMAEKYK